MSAVPPCFAWIAACDGSVLQAYLRYKRGVFQRGVPVMVACLLVAGLVKQAQWLPVGNPLSITLCVVCFAAMAWPPGLASLGWAFWKGAAASAAHATRLRIAAWTLWLLATVSALCLMVVTAMAVYIAVQAAR